MTTYVKGKRLTLKPSDLIGKGGEADVYQLDTTRVLKLYKRPDDPDYIGNSQAQAGAKLRITEHQSKLSDFPKDLPVQVIAPIDLAYDKATGGLITGYTMQYLQGMEVLLRLGDRQYREQGGIKYEQVLATFASLHKIVTLLHQKGVVIGDFNDLNVLYSMGGPHNVAYLVDADSMQFSKYFCRTFTTRFVDPLRCAHNLVLVKAHNEDSDWYAFNTMLFQSLLFVGPYGGVHKPPTGKRLQHDDRVLKRLTLFDPTVIYPKPAIPYDRLPDELLEHFHRVYEKDDRGPFPLDLLKLRWTTCTNCGSQHARNRCPVCAAPGFTKETVVIRGKVTATKEFITSGQILHAVVQGNKLRYLYHDNGQFWREEHVPVMKGNLDPELRFRISRDLTLFGKSDRLFVLDQKKTKQLTTGTVGPLPIFDSSDRNYFWIDGNQLLRSAVIGGEYIGNILPGRTMFWTGKKFGFGFYQAGLIQRAFLFDVFGQGISDLAKSPEIPGQLVDAACVSSEKLIWFMTTTQEQGKLINRCTVIDPAGNLVATLSAENGYDDNWLNSGIRGHFATGNSLFVATDDGIVRVEADPKGGTITVAETFPDTEPFVDSTSQLLPGSGGIYVISHKEITTLRIQ